VDPTGRIVIAGGTGGAPFEVPPDDFFLARVDAAGALDPSFGTGGVVVTDIFGSFSDYARDLVRQADGKIVAVGTIAQPLVDVSLVAVARYDESGAPDNSFGVNGVNAVGAGSEYAVAAALDADGRLLVGGGSTASFLPLITRLTGGVLDPGWPFVTNQGSVVTSLAVQPDGRVLALSDTMVFRILTGDLCGNGTLDPGEQCDDGNVAGGDCCSATCFREADGALCSDGDACTTGDHCQTGTCTGGAATIAPTCMQCDPALGLVARPRLGCKQSTAPGRAPLRIADGGARLGWRWSAGAATTPAELGDPLGDAGSTYDLCVFDDAGLVAASAASSNVAPDCARPPCWRRGSDGRLTYRAAPANAAGLSALQLRPGPAGRASVRAKARAPMLVGPALPLSPPLRVQVWSRAGACFDAAYSAAGVRRSDARRFQASSD
jgi:uncharacterized delta-60 repeat protein